MVSHKGNFPLIQVLENAKKLLALEGNDFLWSTWENEAEALLELNELQTKIMGNLSWDESDFVVLFAPTGPIQEVSHSSGWGSDFLKLSDEADLAIQMYRKNLN